MAENFGTDMANGTTDMTGILASATKKARIDQDEAADQEDQNAESTICPDSVLTTQLLDSDDRQGNLPNQA